ncbi:glutaminyl-peptide cyclotransferase [bacterium]|nr:glutaminyl-peptide cyclotransferase [bacterium]
MKRRFLLQAILATAILSLGLQGTAQAPPDSVSLYTFRALSIRPHDPEAFTQGLLLDGGKLYESTGLEGRSSLRRVDPLTGVVEKKIDLPADIFAEGLALVGDKLIQLTWKNGKAFVYNKETFEKIGEFAYEGEGWGLAYDGKSLLMTDGSNKVTFRNPETFAIERVIEVKAGDTPVTALNELEYVDGVLYANIWQRDLVAGIDPNSGEVISLIALNGLLSPEDKAKADVLNGIAFDPETRSFLVTGKLWPKLFELEFVLGKRPPQ